MSAYSEASKAVFEVFEDTTPLVEGLSIDEAFLDVGGLLRVSGTPTEIAVRLRREVLERVGLRITVGVARTKFLAKVASGVAKPDGLLVVPPERELDFLHPLPVGRLWGVGPITEAKLHDRGIATVGEVASLGEPALVVDARARRRAGTCTRSRTIGIRGRCRSGAAGGRSARSAPSAGRRKSLEEIDAYLAGLVDRVARRLRAAERTCRTVVIRLRFDDFTARHTLAHDDRARPPRRPTILAAARALLAEAAPMIERRGLHADRRRARESRRRRRRAARVAVRPGRAPARSIAALDDVRERFGSRAVTRAALVGRDPGFCRSRCCPTDCELRSGWLRIASRNSAGRRRRRSPGRRSGCRCRSRRR